jgi:hypothetical protein
VGTVLVYAIAAAVYPQLLAVVVIILTRARPLPLLWACYLASLVVSIAGATVIFAVFRSRGTIAGVSSSRLGPAAWFALGGVALLLAIAMATPRGRDLLARSTSLGREPRQPDAADKPKRGLHTRAEEALGEGSLVVAAVVGALLAVPGPFDLLAIGHLARDGYSIVAAIATALVFALVKFVLIETPIAGYVVDPDGTARRVGSVSRWLQDNKLATVAAVIGLIGLVLISRGFSGLA